MATDAVAAGPADAAYSFQSEPRAVEAKKYRQTVVQVYDHVVLCWCVIDGVQCMALKHPP